MADAPRGGAAARGGGFGSRGDRGGDRGDRGRGRGRRGPRRGANKNEEKEWQPVTKLGRLVKDGKIKSMEEIYLHSLPIKEYQIVDFFLPKLKDEVMKVWELRQRIWRQILRTCPTDIFFGCRSSPSRSKLVPVNELDSRLSSLLVTLRDTLVSVSRHRRKSQLLSVLLSSSPS
jgi:hypothetical protein